MKDGRNTAIQSRGRAHILCASPFEEDRAALEQILRRTNWSPCMEPPWLLRTAFTLEEALEEMRSGRTEIVVCERDLRPGGWKELLGAATAMANPPLVIVMSWLADESLWAEALNLGAHDVLRKPLDAAEAARVLGWAWLHRSHGAPHVLPVAGMAATV